MGAISGFGRTASKFRIERSSPERGVSQGLGPGIFPGFGSTIRGTRNLRVGTIGFGLIILISLFATYKEYIVNRHTCKGYQYPQACNDMLCGVVSQLD